MSQTPIDRLAAPQFHRTTDLSRAGVPPRAAARLVIAGRLTKVRRGVFCDPAVPDECVVAVAARGRLACVSELRRRGVFVLDRGALHVHRDGGHSRFGEIGADAYVHRRELHRRPHPRSMSVEVFDALFDAVLCQSPRAAIATLDSAIHCGLLVGDDLDELFALLPRRYRRLRRLLDGRAESGPETLVRLMLRGLGCGFDVQVEIDGVGRVDFVVDGWLIVECDSRQFHGTWEQQLKDLRRDMAAAERGYVTLRLAAEDIMWRPEVVLSALRGAVYGRRGVRSAC